MNKIKLKSALIKINSKNISMLIGTGSATTIIDKELVKKIKKKKSKYPIT